jgi:meso-butanediol dehydrogenase / (S,S)-butanediol dehydrogenase / diacetyl reductase
MPHVSQPSVTPENTGLGPSRLDGVRCVVTGGGAGIGRAAACRLALEGASVCVGDIVERTADETAAEIAAAGGRAVGAYVDVASRQSTRAMIARAVEAFGGVDVMFNNAGIAQAKPFLDIAEDDWEALMRVNGLGVLIGMQEAAKQMIAQGAGGKIVNTASVGGKQGFALVAHYSATKFAVVALTQAGARELAQHRITVNGFCPGIVHTELWDKLDAEMMGFGRSERPGQAMEEYAADVLLGRVSVPEDCAGVCAFLASRDSDYMTGQSIQVDGGMILQ